MLWQASLEINGYRSNENLRVYGFEIESYVNDVRGFASFSCGSPNEDHNGEKKFGILRVAMRCIS